jgi:SHS2 domain-containing protein
MLASEARRHVTPVDHTGDLGLDVSAPTLADLLAAAVLGLVDVIVDGETVVGRDGRNVEVTAPDRELLLVRLLREVLYVYDVERWLPATVEVTVAAGTPVSARAELRGERFDPARHEVKTEVKAVTYHALEVRETARGLRARLILDL